MSELRQPNRTLSWSIYSIRDGASPEAIPTLLYKDVSALTAEEAFEKVEAGLFKSFIGRFVVKLNTAYTFRWQPAIEEHWVSSLE